MGENNDAQLRRAQERRLGQAADDTTGQRADVQKEVAALRAEVRRCELLADDAREALAGAQRRLDDFLELEAERAGAPELVGSSPL